MPPSTDGRWSSSATTIPVPATTIVDRLGNPIPDTRGLFVIHAILLRTGKVLWFCGHVESAFYAPLSYVFDPKNPTTTLKPLDFPSNMDLFCCHYVQIPDGRILVFGGSDLDPHRSRGARHVCIFDPVPGPGKKEWSVSRTGAMNNELQQGRWYPTPVLLPDGRVVVVSGRREHPSDTRPPATLPTSPFIADKVEILSHSSNWSPTVLTDADFTFPIYPGLHLAPNGRIYFTGTNWGQETPNPKETTSIEITAGATSATWTTHADPDPNTHPAQPNREEGMSVLLPPAQDGKILVVGGTLALDSGGNPIVAPGGPGPNGFNRISAATDPFSAEILDTTKEPPTWSPAPGSPMTHGRTNGHCVLLPDATVLILGGHDFYKWNDRSPKVTTGGVTSGGTTPSLDAEIFTPGAGFRVVDRMNSPRMYHSAALLLPDGRVLVAGGADANRAEPTLTYPAGWVGPTYTALHRNDKQFEFYEPPYFFNGTRPVITDVQRGGVTSRQVAYGQTFKVFTPQASSIDKVAFMRPGAVTHHTDSEQRYVHLDFTKTTTELTVTTVSDPKVAPPGYYMLWIVDDQGRPCQEAVFVQLIPPVQPSNGPCFIATAALGSAGHPGVLYLQQLRGELYESTGMGRRFIQTVNRIYYAFSPCIARYLENNRSVRLAVRDWVVRPSVKVIAAVDRATRWIKTRKVRHATLISLLTLEAAIAVASAPVLAAAMLGRIVLEKRRKRRKERKVNPGRRLRLVLGRLDGGARRPSNGKCRVKDGP